MPKISIRTSVLTIVLTLVGIVAFSLLVSQHYFSQKLAIESTNKTFKRITENITEHLRNEAIYTRNILNTKRQHPKLLEPITFNPKHPSLEGLIQVLQIKTNVYAIYFAQENGDFYEVVNMQGNPQLFQTYSAPEQTTWTVITIIKNQQQLAFLDRKLNLIDKNITEKKYDPRVRPWYIKAKKSKGVISTSPYLFSNLNQAGITYATKLDNQGGVLALDYTMEQLNQILALQKVDEKSEIFIVNHNGKTLASSSFMKGKAPEISEITAVEQKISFSQKEQAYIQNNPTLRVSNEDDWVPFDFQDGGEPHGYSIDLLKLLSIKIGLKLQFINGYQWTEIMTMFQKRELDIVHSLIKTKAREKIGLFSKPIFSFKNYFIVPKSSQDIESFNDIKDKTVVVIKGWLTQSFIQDNHPEISLLVVDNVEDAFLALSNAKADVLIDTKESFSYLTQKLYIENLKLSAWCKEFDNNQINSIYLMVHNDDPILLSILNKTLSTLTPSEQQNLHKKWFGKSNDKVLSNILDSELLEVVLDKKTEYVVEYSKDGNRYFAMVMHLVDQNSYLGIKIDADALFKPYRENIEYSFFIAFSLLLLSLPIIFIGTSFIIKPIKALIRENEKIKHRKFHQVRNIETYISEFGDLSDSFVSMSHSIQAYEKDQEKLLDSIIKLIAEAIDAKSHYTGGHCERVPEIAQLLLDEANRSNEGVFKNFSFTSKEELKEFEIGAWLHDCGKVTTPEYVVDKSTKLETIYNRIHEIRMRFEVLWRDAEIAYLKREISLNNLHEKQEDLRNDFEFIAGTNIGGEFMDKGKQERIKKIAIQEWQRNFDDRLGLGEVERSRYEEMATGTLPVLEKLLSDKVHHIVKRENFNQQTYDEEGFKVTVPEHLYNYGEIYNLCIAKGTLSPEERYKINEHVIMSIKMLEKIPFPEHLRNIPEYAGTHHETLIGTGYPRKLTKEELSIPARIMAIADIFEALTASDRPYKKAKTLTDSIKIMSFMAKDQHIDTDLFNLFLKSGVYQVYAQQYLKPEQIDSVDIDNYLV